MYPRKEGCRPSRFPSPVERRGQNTHSFHLARWGIREYVNHTVSFTASDRHHDAGDSAVVDPVHVEAATSKDKPDWKDIASSAAKLLLRTVERASDAFPPLKSVAAGLCAILDNCEVYTPSPFPIHGVNGFPSERSSTDKRWNHWDTGSKCSSNRSAHLLSKVMLRRERGGRNWHGMPNHFSIES